MSYLFFLFAICQQFNVLTVNKLIILAVPNV